MGATKAVKAFVAIRSSDSAVYLVWAHDLEDAYHVFGREVLGMDEPIDTGNVDIELYAVERRDKPGVRGLTDDE